MRIVVRRLGAIALTMAILASAMSVATQSVSAAFGNGDEVVVFDGALNLRATPGMAGLIIQVLPDATPLTVTGDLQNVEGMDWYPVITATAVAGWVSGQFIMLASPSGDFAIGDDVVVADGPLNMRNAAGTGATIVDTLPTGATATIAGGPTAANGYDWYQLNLGGWVAGDFLALAAAGPPPVAGDFAIGDDISVFDGPVNLRNAAGLSGIVLEILPQDTTGTVVGGPAAADGYDWYQIEVTAGQIGWIASDFLALATPGPGDGDFAVGDDIYVFDGPVNLRSAAGLIGAILEILPQDATGTVLGGPTTADGYDWYQIQVDGGQSGWVAGAFLALVDNGPVAPPGNFPVDSFVFVNVAKLNLRSIASVDGAVLQTMNDGGIATVKSGPVSAGGFAWYELFVGEGQNTITGWAAGEYLTGGIELGAFAVVADGPLNLRQAATTNSASLGALQTGDIVEVISGPIFAGEYIWFGVESGGIDGFVAGRFLGAV